MFVSVSEESARQGALARGEAALNQALPLPLLAGDNFVRCAIVSRVKLATWG